MRTFARAIAAVTMLAIAGGASAQFSHRDRGGSPRDEAGWGKREQKKDAPLPSDPFAALERELPSLSADLQLRPEQLDAWNAFQRDVRAAAEVQREQFRRLLALRAPDAAPATGMAVIASLADDARRRAEVLAELRTHLQALYERFDARQRGMLDRRIVQSQTEPLGR